ncbi:MAG: BatA domain-containing protein [Bacteroidetes bacterium]|nr:BatA domain-containing protein [Bacteroidota bacterium]
MHFLNPLYLIALAAAAIPIILHLLNLRKTRVIEFSTLSFLKELQKSRIRKLKLKQWLLLALRTLIIVFVVLAFTRPALRSGLGFLPGTTAKTSVVIVLDNSFSMLVSDEHGQLLKQARQKAAELVDLMEAGDEAALVLTTEAEKGHDFTAALNALRGEIEDVEPSFAHGDYRQALTAAGALLAQSDNFNKEVYILTDRQRSQYVLDDGTQQPLFDAGVRVFVLPVGDGDAGNTAVVEAAPQNAIYERGKPVEVRAALRNLSETPMRGSIVSVFLGGERVAQQTVDVEAGGFEQVDFTVIPKQTGWIDGFVELEDDRLPEDNRRYFGFFIPEQLDVLLGPAGGRDARLISLALNPAADDPETPQSFRIDALDRGALLSANLSRYQVAVLFGAKGLSDAFIQRLASWVRDGGRVLLFPDADGDVAAWSNTLLPQLGIPAPAGTTGSPTGGSSFVSFGEVDFDHPLFANVFMESGMQEKPEIESPRLYYSVRLRGDERARQVISTRAGDGFLLDARVGEGRALVFAVSPDLAWSDFPFKGVFVPLMNRGLFYLAARDDNALAMTVGATAEITVPKTVPGEGLFELRGPEGAVQRIVPKTLPSGLVFPVESPSVPGVYTLASGDQVLRSIAVNTDPVESDLARADAELREQFFSRLGITNITELGTDVNVRQAVAEVRFGVELWKYMLLLALLCALLEMLVARDVKQSKIEIE